MVRRNGGRAGVIDRHLAPQVIAALDTSRIVNVVGPRQAGKSTLIRELVPIADYVTLDDDLARESIRADPYGLLRSLADRHKGTGLPIALDEVQRVPEMTLALKRIVDDDNVRGQFILTGSADVFGLREAGDSLAGRVRTLTLRPLSAAEIQGAGPCLLLDAVEAGPAAVLPMLPQPLPFQRSDAIDLMLRGGFPEIRTLDDRSRRSRYDSYMDSIIVSDVPVVAPVRKPQLLRSLVNQLAARTAQELNMAKLCEAVGARRETLAGWIDILERVGLVSRLPSWSPSATRRDLSVHWPKLHLLDMGCASAIRGETPASFELGADPTALGAILESYVYTELEKTRELTRSAWNFFHWRSKDREIDIIAEGPGRRLALFEMKASASVSPSDFKHIDWFLSDGPGQGYAAGSVGFVVYLGDKLMPMGAGRVCLPLSMLWSFR
ncbi:ATP-binding protein (plasmid) [Skermanella rosea]|uniref:ATP-binding protein n=1 Tax=Skermanella rosea TaxID=1817965 RepID=UPI001931821B|nr:ATP-binding protein [Skermanella rosea]UEM06909.1 ATP-binding protein [Skermanella rosea]